MHVFANISLILLLLLFYFFKKIMDTTEQIRIGAHEISICNNIIFIIYIHINTVIYIYIVPIQPSWPIQ